MPMPTEQQISEVLGEIQDPELHRGLNELNMVRNISIEGNRVSTLIALTIPGCPLKSYFTDVIPAKLKQQFSEIEDVSVELTSMTDQERQALIGGIRQETPAPFARSDSPTQVIAVGSGKGGVGKSTVTVNLAASLAKLGHSGGRVGFLDSAHAGRSRAPDRGAGHDHAAGNLRCEGRFDWVVHDRGQPRCLARADAAQGASTISDRCALG
jgi:ATP-binding protein involved in chromosome partitioning